jgi:hypothetical protein
VSGEQALIHQLVEMESGELAGYTDDFSSFVPPHGPSCAPDEQVHLAAKIVLEGSDRACGRAEPVSCPHGLEL